MSEDAVFNSSFIKSLSFLALLAVIVSVAVSQSNQQADQQAKSEPEVPAAAATPAPAIADNATLNLHRW